MTQEHHLHREIYAEISKRLNIYNNFHANEALILNAPWQSKLIGWLTLLLPFLALLYYNILTSGAMKKLFITLLRFKQAILPKRNLLPTMSKHQHRIFWSKKIMPTLLLIDTLFCAFCLGIYLIPFWSNSASFTNFHNQSPYLFKVNPSHEHYTSLPADQILDCCYNPNNTFVKPTTDWDLVTMEWFRTFYCMGMAHSDDTVRFLLESSGYMGNITSRIGFSNTGQLITALYYNRLIDSYVASNMGLLVAQHELTFGSNMRQFCNVSQSLTVDIWLKMNSILYGLSTNTKHHHQPLAGWFKIFQSFETGNQYVAKEILDVRTLFEGYQLHGVEASNLSQIYSKTLASENSRALCCVCYETAVDYGWSSELLYIYGLSMIFSIIPRNNGGSIKIVLTTQLVVLVVILLAISHMVALSIYDPYDILVPELNEMRRLLQPCIKPLLMTTTHSYISHYIILAHTAVKTILVFAAMIFKRLGKIPVGNKDLY